jgi:hypothetical protein
MRSIYGEPDEQIDTNNTLSFLALADQIDRRDCAPFARRLATGIAGLQHRELLLSEWDRLDWRNRLDLIRRSTSAFWDAVWMQTTDGEDAMVQDLRYGARMLRSTKALQQ